MSCDKIFAAAQLGTLTGGYGYSEITDAYLSTLNRGWLADSSGRGEMSRGTQSQVAMSWRIATSIWVCDTWEPRQTHLECGSLPDWLILPRWIPRNKQQRVGASYGAVVLVFIGILEYRKHQVPPSMRGKDVEDRLLTFQES